MKILKTKFRDLLIFKKIIHNDNRGYFKELFEQKKIKKKFIFDYLSLSKKNVIRGIHIQLQNPQAKLITVFSGEIFDVVIDCRKKSKTFGKHYKIILSDKNCKSLLIPSGFAHGILGLANENIIFYGNNNYRSVNSEVTIKWNDQKLKIKWPRGKKIISKKDKKGKTFEEFLNLKNEM